MAKLKNKFDSRKVDAADNYELLEEGWYTAIVDASEMRETKAGDGSYLSLRFRIIDGKGKGRVVFTNLNLDNPNPVAVEIAEKNFSALCQAAGVMVVTDTEQLHGKPVSIRIKVTPAKGQYEARNDVKGYKALEDAPAFAQAAAEAQQKNEERSAPSDANYDSYEGDEEEEDEDGPAWLRED